MRTTLTLDDGIARQLKEMAHRADLPFKTVVDKVLRVGIETLDRPARRKPYRARTFKLGEPGGLDLDKALGLASRLEDQEIARKVALRK